MPFFFWIPFLLFDLKYGFVDEYFVQFGAGPTLSSFSYDLGGGESRLSFLSPGGEARVGVRVTPEWGFFLSTVGTGYFSEQEISGPPVSGKAGAGLASLGLGALYRTGDFQWGGGVHYNTSFVDPAEDSIGHDTRGSAAAQVFVEYILGENHPRAEKGEWFKMLGSVSLNGVATASGDYSVGVFLNGSLGVAPSRREASADRH
jgi:hypothetical protein